MQDNNMRNGFTLIELALVVGLLAILTAVSVSTINASLQREKAEDGVKSAKVKEYSEALLTYMYAEGSLPQSINFNTYPSLSKYIKEWNTIYTYTYQSQTEFSVQVAKSVKKDNQVLYLKYSTVWGSVKECGSTTTTAYDSCN